MSKRSKKSRTFLVLTFVLLILAVPVLPFDSILEPPSFILIPQLLALSVLAAGGIVDILFSRPLLRFSSIISIALRLWQLLYIDREYVDAKQ